MEWNKYIKELLIGAAVIVVLAITFFIVMRSPSDLDANREEGVTLEALLSEAEEDELEIVNENKVDLSEHEEDKTVVVDVKGAVIHPGVFSFDADQRVIDAVEAAGGLADNADTKHINFAQLLEDEMYIYIPLEGEETAYREGLIELTSKEAKVNINRADESELLKLTGIGPSKASAIIKYREESGPFGSIEDIMNVSGIGEKTFEVIHQSIEVD